MAARRTRKTGAKLLAVALCDRGILPDTLRGVPIQSSDARHRRRVKGRLGVHRSWALIKRNRRIAWPVSWHLGFGGGAPWDVVMNLLLLLLLALPFACLAVLSLVALLGVVAIGGTLRMIGMVTSLLGLAGRKVDDPWRDAVGDAHPLDYVEVAR